MRAPTQSCFAKSKACASVWKCWSALQPTNGTRDQSPPKSNPCETSELGGNDMALDSFVICAAALTGLCIIASALLKAWHGWLALKSRELENLRPELEGGAPSGMARIEIAD